MIAYLSKIIRFNRINVVGVFKEEDTTNYTVLQIKRKNNKVSVIARRNFTSIEKLNEKLDKKTPVLILLDGKGILNKQININNDSDISWQKNIDYDNIYYTSFKSDNYTFISFCRKTIVDENITVFQKNKFQILDIYIGSFQGALLHNSIKENSIISGDLELTFNNGALISFTKLNPSTSKSYNLDNDWINNKELALYGSLLHFFVKPDNIEKTNNSALNIEEIIYKKAFNFLGVTMLVGFLASLFVSYLLIRFYGSENAELNMKNMFSNQSYHKITALEKQKEEKLNIAKRLGTLSNKYLTFYAFELLNNIPVAIAIDELNIFPADKEFKPEKKINFQSNTILVKGETFNEKAIDEWMHHLKNLEWVKTFEITSLKKDKNNKTLFEIKITVKNV